MEIEKPENKRTEVHQKETQHKTQTIRKNNLITETKYNNKEQNINRGLRLIEENDEELSHKKNTYKRNAKRHSSRTQ